MEPTTDTRALQNTNTSLDQEKTMPMVVYILFLVSLVTGGLLSVVGVIIAYVKKGSASSEINNNHYRYQIRTFWIGMLYSLIGLLSTFLVVGFLILLFAVVWYVVRCVIGLTQLNKGEPVKNVTSWLF